MQIIKTALLSSALLLLGCDSRPTLPTSSTFTLEHHTGVWQSQGYGYIMKIDVEGMQLFDRNQAGCIQKNISSADIAENMAVFKNIDENHISVSATPNSTQYHFERLTNSQAELIKTCLTSINTNPVENFNYFSQTMAEHYAFFDTYQQNWPKIVKKYQDKINNSSPNSQLFNVLSSMLKDLDDAHLFLAAEVDGNSKLYQPSKSRTLRPALDRAFAKQNDFEDPKAFRLNWYENYKSQVREAVLEGNANEIGKFIIWGMIDNIGYINLQRMQDFSESASIQDDMAAIEQAMDTMMNTLSKSDAIVLDITANGGGHDEVGLVLARYFNQKKRLAYSKIAFGGDHSQQYYLDVAQNIAYTKPVYLVTSDHTVSAAETFTMAMKSLPQVIHVGDTTRGSHSDILDKMLLNGWHLGLSNEIYKDSTGKVSEGKGLVPERMLPIFAGDDIFNSHSIAIQTLLKEVKSKL